MAVILFPPLSFYTVSKHIYISDDKHIRENYIKVEHYVGFSDSFGKFKVLVAKVTEAHRSIHLICHYQKHVVGKVWSKLYKWREKTLISVFTTI